MTKRPRITTLTDDMARCVNNPADRAVLGLPLAESIAAESPAPVKAPAKRGPNKTEALYRDTHLRGQDARYEALTVKLANGHRYTPDYAHWDDGVLVLTEVKGSYKLHSHGRARLAFDQARVEWPQFRWVWATKRTAKDGGGFRVEVAP